MIDNSNKKKKKKRVRVNSACVVVKKICEMWSGCMVVVYVFVV